MSEELKSALARIACLEGEIAKRDARIAEVEGALLAEQMQAEDLSHELAAIKAQEPVARQAQDGSWHPFLSEQHYQNTLADGWPIRALYAAPVSEAKAQVVVMPEEQAAFEAAVAAVNERGWSTSTDLARQIWNAARLNAANVQQVRVPDGYARVPTELTDEMLRAMKIQLDKSPVFWCRYRAAYRAMLNAAPVQRDQAFCEYCGGNDEEPQDHCMDCTRPVQHVSVPDERAAFEKWGETLFYTACFERHESDEYAGRGLQGAWLGWQARAMLAAAPAAPAADALVEALEHARLFIVNGIDLGFIQMPEAGTPDPAHETLPMIEAALAAHRSKGGV